MVLAHRDGSWTDPESQIAKYRWWVGTTNTTADIYGPIELEPSLLSATALVPAKIQSHRAVYVTLEAVNRAGCGSTKYVVDVDNRFLDFGNATALDSWRGRFSALSERELTESFYVRDPSYVNSWWYNITDEQGVQRFDVGFVATNSSRGYDPDCTLTLTGVYHGAPGFGKATFHTAAAESLVYGQSANGFLPGEYVLSGCGGVSAAAFVGQLITVWHSTEHTARMCKAAKTVHPARRSARVAFAWTWMRPRRPRWASLRAHSRSTPPQSCLASNRSPPTASQPCGVAPVGVRCRAGHSSTRSHTGRTSWTARVASSSMYGRSARSPLGPRRPRSRCTRHPTLGRIPTPRRVLRWPTSLCQARTL